MDNNNNNSSGNYNQDIWQQQPTPTFEPEQPKKPNYDTPALVLGIVSAVFALIGACTMCCAPIAIITSIIGIIFVIVTTKNGHPWNAMRIVALVLNIVSILGLVLWFLYIILFMNSAAGQTFMEEYMKMYEEIMNDPSLGGAYYN